MKYNLKVCFIVNEAFGWGVFGGFGYLSRLLAEGLHEKSVHTYILTPRRAGQREVEIVDEAYIYGYRDPPRLIPFLKSYCQGDVHNEVGRLLKKIDADVYHSQEPSEYSYVVSKMSPHSKHVITFQDPWSINEIYKIGRLEGANFIRLSFSSMYHKYIRQIFVKRALNRANGIFCQAKYIIPMVVKMYKLQRLPGFLPNPVKIPRRILKKSDEPTVVFLARWDYVKIPEMFFNLARLFPKVRFIALGRCHVDPLRDAKLRRKYSKIPNLEMPGFVSEEEKTKILEEAWILVNTSIHECLPISFLEGAAHKCAILSHEDPDGFATKFGFKAELSLKSYSKGLTYLLDNERWKSFGEKAYEYVNEVHEFNKVIDLHLLMYRKLLSN